MSKLELRLLLSKLKQGKKEYFDRFYGLTKGAVWYELRKTLRDEFAAEDIMQEAYLAFLNNLDKVSGDPLPYLVQVAKNKAIDYIRRNSRISLDVPIEDLQLKHYDSYSTDNYLLEACRARLSAEDFLILEYTVIFGYTRVAVAKLLKKPISTVNRRYNQILKEVKRISKEAHV